MLLKIFLLFLVQFQVSLAQEDVVETSGIEQWRELVDNFSSNLQESETSEQSYLSTINTLVEVGKERASLLAEKRREVGYNVFKLSDHYIEDVTREIKLVPEKWFSLFKLKVSNLTNQLNTDYIGLAQFIFEILKLLGIIIIPFVCYLVSVRITENFKAKRAELIKGLYRGEKNLLLTEMLRVFISYGPWFVSWFALWLSYKLLQSSEYFSELAPLIYVFRFYIYFKLFQKIVLESLLKISRARINDKKADIHRMQARAKKHASRVAGVIMLSQALSELVGTAVNKGLVFHTISLIATFVVIGLLFFTASEWKEDLSAKLKSYEIPFLSTWFADSILKWNFFFLCLPALFIVIFINIFQMIFNWAERFDFMKKVTAKIFKRKLESSQLAQEEALQNIPTEYSSVFKEGGKDALKFYVNPAESELENIFKSIELWNDDEREENSLALIGEKGSGKSTTLSLLEERFKDLKVVHLKLSKKLVSTQDTFGFIGESLGVELKESIVPLIKFDEQTEKTLVIIDDAHNCFLSKVGAFEGYKALLTIVNAKLENLFFCFAFDLFAWNYLASAFKRENSFRNVFHQKRFNELDIKSLVLKRHDEQDYKLLYYDILKASGNKFTGESREAVTEQFFRLLWEQSLGNPEISMGLWLSSLKYQGKKQFKLGIPYEDELKMLNDLSEQSLFVYAAIVKHENLSVRDIKDITNIIESDIRYAIRFGLDNGFLSKIENTANYTFNARYQHSLVSYLKKKNLVYAR